MTSKPDLGPILLGAGLAVALAAIIAGFIAVGGPGNARKERIDEQTLRGLDLIVASAGCTHEVTGDIPESLTELFDLHDKIRDTNELPVCQVRWDNDEQVNALLKDETIEYERLDPSRIRLCADFLAPTNPTGGPYNYAGLLEHQALLEVRTAAGRHCYEIDLAD